MTKQAKVRNIKDLRKLSDAQLRALSDDQFWDAIEPEGICPHCDPRLGAEAIRRGGSTFSEQLREWSPGSEHKH